MKLPEPLFFSRSSCVHSPFPWFCFAFFYWPRRSWRRAGRKVAPPHFWSQKRRADKRRTLHKLLAAACSHPCPHPFLGQKSCRGGDDRTYCDPRRFWANSSTTSTARIDLTQGHKAESRWRLSSWLDTRWVKTFQICAFPKIHFSNRYLSLLDQAWLLLFFSRISPFIWNFFGEDYSSKTK